jgi:hypothetical protein
MKHWVKVIQTFRVEREIVVEVEAPTKREAVDLQEGSDAPDYDDPRWKETKRKLVEEDVLNANREDA